MTRRSAKAAPHADIGERLRLTRVALGVTQAAVADRAGLARNTYNQYETGINRPHLEGALALCEAYKLTLDWIYRGDITGIPHGLATTIEALRKAEGK